MDLAKLWAGQSYLELQKHKEARIQFSFSAGFGKAVRTRGFIHHQTNRIRNQGQRDRLFHPVLFLAHELVYAQEALQVFEHFLNFHALQAKG